MHIGDLADLTINYGISVVPCARAGVLGADGSTGHGDVKSIVGQVDHGHVQSLPRQVKFRGFRIELGEIEAETRCEIGEATSRPGPMVDPHDCS